MLVIPALDIRDGQVVRLVKGDFANEKLYSDDPLEAARAYRRAGATRLHVVDLDAARGAGDNRRLVERMVREAGLEVQVAGGVRTAAAVAAWLESGAAAAVMGTTAICEPEKLGQAAAAHPGRVFAALDVRGRRPAMTGWSEVAELPLQHVLELWSGTPLAGVILTSIDRDGTLSGPDLDVLADVMAATSHSVTYSGGIASLADLAAVAAAGADGAILGKSLLEGRFTLSEALALS